MPDDNTPPPTYLFQFSTMSKIYAAPTKDGARNLLAKSQASLKPFISWNRPPTLNRWPLPRQLEALPPRRGASYMAVAGGCQHGFQRNSPIPVIFFEPAFCWPLRPLPIGTQIPKILTFRGLRLRCDKAALARPFVTRLSLLHSLTHSVRSQREIVNRTLTKSVALLVVCDPPHSSGRPS